MKRSIIHIIFVAIGFALTAPSYSAGYLKIGDIKGETTDERQASTSAGVQRKEPAKRTLLLPAVQKAKEAEAEGKAKKKGNVEYNWKVEEGSK